MFGISFIDNYDLKYPADKSTCIWWHIQFKALDHKNQQTFPVLKVDIAGQSTDIIKKSFTCWQFASEKLVVLIDHFKYSMKQECQDVQC